jgi:hypothetical protein
MRRVPTRKALTVAAAALVVGGGGGAAIAASQSERPSPSSFLDAVARHLGVSRDELDDATKAAALDQVDAALEAGRITEAQAEELRSRIQSSEVPPFFGPFFGGFHDRMHGLGADLSAAAEYLDLSVDELRRRLARGQSLADVAEAQEKTVDGVEQAMLSGAEQRLDDAVADGTLTRERADEMLERLRSRIDALVSGELPWWRGHHRGPPPFPRL